MGFPDSALRVSPRVLTGGDRERDPRLSAFLVPVMPCHALQQQACVLYMAQRFVASAVAYEASCLVPIDAPRFQYASGRSHNVCCRCLSAFFLVVPGLLFFLCVRPQYGPIAVPAIPLDYYHDTFLSFNRSKKSFEVVQAYLHRFLKHYSDLIMVMPDLREASKALRDEQVLILRERLRFRVLF